MQAEKKIETQEETLEKKKHCQKNAVWKKLVSQSSQKIDGNSTPYSIKGLKAVACILVEQEVDLKQKKLKLKILGEPQGNGLLTLDKGYYQFKANKDRLIFKGSPLY